MPACVILLLGDEYRPPTPDHVVLPVVSPAEWAHMRRAWLKNHHRARVETV